MKFKKFIAAASAVTMLGALTAVPSFAYTTQEDVFVANEDTEWKLNEANGGYAEIGGNTLTIKGDTSKADSFTIRRDDSVSSMNSPVQVRTNEQIHFDANTTYHISFDYDYNITTLPTSTSTQNLIYARFPDGSKEDVKAATDKTILKGNSSLSEDKTHGKDTYSFDMTPTYAKDWNIQFYLRYANGEVTISNLKITKDVEKTTEKVEIKSDYNSDYVIYKGDSINLSALVDGAERDGVTWKITGPKSNDDSTTTDYTDKFTIANGTLTYNDVGRCGDTTGEVSITATYDDITSDPLVIKTQRLRNTSYKITDKSGDTPDMTVETKVNDEIKTDKTSGNVSYDSAVATGNNYSGNSTFEMAFTVPDGYKLTTTKIFKGVTETTEGNKVIYSSTTDIHNDFYIEAALEKIETPAAINAAISNADVYTGANDTKALGFITTVTSDKEASVKNLTWKVTGHDSDFTYTPDTSITLNANTAVYFGVIIDGYNRDVVPEITANAE